MLMFSSCNPKFFAVRHIHCPVNPSSDHFHNDAVVPSSDHCRSETVLPDGTRMTIASGLRMHKHASVLLVRKCPERVICFPINAPGMGRFQLLNLGLLGYYYSPEVFT